MKANIQYPIGLSAPNVINLCIDNRARSELSGRVYHCYDKRAQRFQNLVQMLRIMEEFYDSIAFPQAADETRCFIRQEKCQRQFREKQVTQQELMEHQGKLGTFVICVKHRQHATWQGEAIWLENGDLRQFSSQMELIRLLDTDMESNALEKEGLNDNKVAML